MSCPAARDLLLKKNGGMRADILIAASTIVRCTDIGPATLIRVLRSASANSLRDSAAQRVAWRLSDSRMLDSVIAFANDAGLPAVRPTIGLRLLTHYADQRAWLNPEAVNDSLQIVISTTAR
jgi:hypothetical protein